MLRGPGGAASARTQSDPAGTRAYTYYRIVELPSAFTIAYARTWTSPTTGIQYEESICHSGGVWEPTRRLWRIEMGLDDYVVGTIDAAAVDEHPPPLPQSDYRHFAVVRRNSVDFSLNDPADVVRVRDGRKTGVLERFRRVREFHDRRDVVRGLRDGSLIEITWYEADMFHRRRSAPPPPAESEYTYYAALDSSTQALDTSCIVRQWWVGADLREETLSDGPEWVKSRYGGRSEPRSTNRRWVQISLDNVERSKSQWRYTYYEIIPPDSDEPMAVVRHYEALGGREDAAVGWPAWYPSLWLKQIADGKVPYRARQVDDDAVQRYLRRAALARPKYRYFVFVGRNDSIDTDGQIARMGAGPEGWLGGEETPQRDGSWVLTQSMLEIDHGRGDWWLNPVEVPAWLFERRRAILQGDGVTD